MDVWQWILTIVLFIVSLGILIVIHELGHFSMAKLFNVYCQEFSIGFGPALLHKRKKGHETYFSIRAIPLGGYVSMYGEGAELEPGVVLDESRSIDGVKRWKKAIIVSAGIFLNALLALTLFAVSNLCFPQTKISTRASVAETSEAYEQGLRDNDRMFVYGPDGDQLVVIDDKINGTDYKGYFYIIDPNVTIDEKHYVMVFEPSTNRSEPLFNQSIYLFPADSDGRMLTTSIFTKWTNEEYTLPYYPDVTADVLQPFANVTFTTNIGFCQYLGVDEKGTQIFAESPTNYSLAMEAISINSDNSSYAWKDVGISFKLYEYWAPFGTRLANTFIDFGNGAIAVFKGLGSLFTSGIKNMSGVVGILNASATYLSQYTFNYYLNLWGLISINLAIFNLIPFPGLDGWALLVTAIEGGVNASKKAHYKATHSDATSYQEWKIPSKVKNIVSYVGLALLFMLMIAIVVVDVMRWIG